MIDLHATDTQLFPYVIRYRHLSPPLPDGIRRRWASEAGVPLPEPKDAADQPAVPHWLDEPVYPDATEADRCDRAVGALLGLAVGDAVGTTLEFRPRDQAHVDDMVGGGPFGLLPGEWTDDTSMALCLADSLAAERRLDLPDFARRLTRWYRDGENSMNGRCFDIGGATRTALEAWLRDGRFIGNTAPDTAGNGSLIRLAPVAIHNRHALRRSWGQAASQSSVTHNAADAKNACQLFAVLLHHALSGASKGDCLAPKVLSLSARNLLINAGEYKDKSREQIRSSGYVIDTLEAALWSVWHTDSFEDAVLLAANLGDDADSVAATAGQLAGALYGAGGIPARWRDRLAWSGHIAGLADALFTQAPPRD